MTAEPLRIPLPAYGVDAVMPEDITLLAFDPGGTTGWYLATFDPKSGEVREGSHRWGELDKPNHHGQLWHLLSATLAAYPHLMVVTEMYIPEFGRAQNYSAMEYNGVIAAFCRVHQISMERQPRAIKKYWTREKLTAVGFWRKGSVHIQDASRHWLAYAAKQSLRLHLNLAKMVSGK